jgi:mannosyl-3-phosphoglycerate phosphatase
VQLVISTDLDGTLIDHHNYSFSAALPALEKCHRAGIPVLFNTSKNASEALALQQQMGVNSPIIVENGSALILENERVVFGVNRSQILNFIERFKRQHGNLLEGFNDWSEKQLVEHTQLDQASAQLALKKEYSEPFLWHGNKPQLKQLETAASKLGFCLTKGGRFYHLQGKCDKALPLNYLKSHREKLFSGDTALKLVCLGDNHNDVAMLECADIAVCVKSSTTDYPKFDTSNNQHTIYTQLYGPEGWNAAVEDILARYCY